MANPATKTDIREKAASPGRKLATCPSTMISGFALRNHLSRKSAPVVVEPLMLPLMIHERRESVSFFSFR